VKRGMVVELMEEPKRVYAKFIRGIASLPVSSPADTAVPQFGLPPAAGGHSHMPWVPL
jgi:hypothetical protein